MGDGGPAMVTDGTHPAVVTDGGPVAAVVPAGPDRRVAAAVAGGVALLLVADLPGVSSGVWAPKMAVLLVLGAAGLPLLVARAAGADRPDRRPSTRPAARAALVFVAVAALATAASPAAVSAVVGLYGQGTGLVFVVALAGMWALGTAVDAPGRPLVEVAVVVGAAVNALVAVAQEVVGLGAAVPADAALPTGLLGNPAFLGAVCAAALALLAARFAARPWAWAAPVVLLGVAVGASGERLSALSVVGIAALELAVAGAGGRPGGSPARRLARWSGAGGTAVGRAAAFGSVSVVAVVAGSFLPSLSGHASAGVLGRAAHTSVHNTVTGRVDAWRAALVALGHRPLLGFGPGQFRDAIAGAMTLHQYRSVPLDVFVGAHDLVVEYATTTGLLGVAALVAWLVLAVRRRRGRLVVAAVVLLACALAQPQEVAATPLLFLLLGAARTRPGAGAPVAAAPGRGPVGRAPASDRRPGRPLRVATGVSMVVAAGAGLALVTGDAAYGTAVRLTARGDHGAAIAAARRADRLLFPWPDPQTLVAANLLAEGRAAPAAVAALAAADRDPTDAELWDAVAAARMAAGDLAGAGSAARRAVGLARWDTAARGDLALIADRRGRRPPGPRTP